MGGRVTVASSVPARARRSPSRCRASHPKAPHAPSSNGQSLPFRHGAVTFADLCLGLTRSPRYADGFSSRSTAILAVACSEKTEPVKGSTAARLATPTDKAKDSGALDLQGAGRDVPLPALLEVGRGVPEGRSRRPHQLPVDRLGRRHPPDHREDGRFRRDRRADDRRRAGQGARQARPHPDDARRGRRSPTTSPA